MSVVRTVRGEWRPLPAKVERAVMDLAFRLHRPVASDDLFLVALAGLEDASPSAEVLRAEGVTVDRLLEGIRTTGDERAAAAPQSLGYAPAYYSMHGRADAFAASLGDGTITPEHVLLALVWDAGSHSSQMLWRLGVSRERLVEGLRLRGVAVPAAPLPPQHEMEHGEPVWFDRDQVQAVIDHLRLHLPPGTHWGFNYEGDRAWVATEGHVDLEALVNGALPPEIAIRRIHHVQMAMPEGREDDAATFYEGLLGLARVRKPERLAGRGGCWFEQGKARVRLDVDRDFRPARKTHAALLVRGLPALTRRLRKAGVPVVEGNGSVYVDDPLRKPGGAPGAGRYTSRTAVRHI